jgi:hypothetical protein
MTQGLAYKMRVYLSKHMIACDEAGFLISLHEDQRLGLRRWWQLKMHLLTCHLCRKYARQIGQLTNTMEAYRDHCDHEPCGHKLSSEAGARMGEAVSRVLNAK